MWDGLTVSCPGHAEKCRAVSQTLASSLQRDHNVRLTPR